MQDSHVMIIGAGPAGLTAGYELLKQGKKVTIVEQSDRVGGISRTETYKGYRFDIGGHRFFTKVEEVQQFWKEILGNEFIKVPRLSRIYYEGKLYDYPLSITNTLSNLGLWRSFLILLSYLQAKLRSKLGLIPDPETFEDWVINCFGDRLYRTFFKVYTEKVWGISCDQIRADWAAQRIQGMSLKRAVINAIWGSQNAKSLIKEFDYPTFGPGMMWERCQEKIEQQQGSVQLHTTVQRVERQGSRVKSVTVHRGDGEETISADHFISSIPVTALLRQLDPPAPPEVLEAARGLKYRDFLIVALVVNQEQLFPDNWIYIHSPEFKVGRIQNFKNWSPCMVPDASKTSLGMEYFCGEGDELWELSDRELINLASREAAALQLGVNIKDVEDGAVIRQRKAYPVYDGEYSQHLQVIQDYLATFENLQTVGRNGMHRYNNQDHSMLTAMLAVRNLAGEKHNLWNVNVERSYQEEFTKESWDRLKKNNLQKLQPSATPMQTSDPAIAEVAKTQVTLVVTPRERFSYTRESLESIYQYTTFPFKLVYIDGNSPEQVKHYLQEQSQIRGFDLIRTDYYLFPNRARNIGLVYVDTPYVVFIDNDVVVSPGWLEALVNCAEETNATVVGPLMCQFLPLHENVHFAGGESHVVVDVQGRRRLREKMYKQGKDVAEVRTKLQRAVTELSEFHCMLVRTKIFRTLGNFDETMLNTKEHLDFCMAVMQAGGSVYFEPESIATYVPTTPLNWSDLHFYMLRWSDAWELASLSRLRQKWDLAEDSYFQHKHKALGWRRRSTILQPLINRLMLGTRNEFLNKLLMFGLFAPVEKRLNRYLTDRYEQRQHFLANDASVQKIDPVRSPISEPANS
ncbi:FAD-dependent oxidoreductase [Altericista sp. CCNU0014]|uniref:FAD-dependent oxidoreductase n=1 Tax=Altericista sp. CCNU0014 TaxID=3082949 RepID=UPI00384F1681